MRGLMMDYQLTLGAILRRAEVFYGGVEIVSWLGDEHTNRYRYCDMIQRAKKLAVALRRLGIGPGDRVATLAWNQHQHLEAYFAVPALGAVLHTLNLRLHPNELAYIVVDSGDRVLLVDRSLLPLFEQFRARINVEHVIVMGGAGEMPAGAIGYEDFVAAADAQDFVEADLDEHDAAAMCYSSGTTGRPKGALYSHRALVLLAMNWTAADTAGVRQRDVILPAVPMFHINGWGLPFAAVHVGAKLVLPGSHVDPRGLLGLISSEHVTLSAGVPTVWRAVLERLDAEPAVYDVSSLRMLVLGGSAVPPALFKGYLERFGVNVVQAWGMTETTSLATVCVLPPDLEQLEPDLRYAWNAKQGVPMPLVEIRARGPEGLVPWDGKTSGELEVRGPTVASAYYHGTDGAGFTEDHWFRTGDIVTIDPRGFIEIKDRAKDLIKSGGEWIGSVALENALMGHPAVAEAAVIAVPHPKWDERPLAVVVLKPGQSATPEELRDHLAPDFPKWSLPDAFAFVDEIPRTSTGKFLKSALRERFANGQDAPPLNAHGPELVGGNPSVRPLGSARSAASALSIKQP